MGNRFKGIGDSMKRLFLSVVLFLIMTISFQNCSVVSSPADTDDLNSAASSSAAYSLPGDSVLAKQTQSILVGRCNSCHGSAGMGGVSNISDLAGLIKQNFVVPADPDSSSLVMSVESGSMPPSGTQLNSGEVGVIRAWIMSLQSTTPPVVNPPPVTPPPVTPPPTTTTTTLPPPPPTTTLTCQIVVTPSGASVPGDTISLQLTWAKFSIAPTNAVLDGLNYDVRGKTNVVASAAPVANKTFTASVTGSNGTANCQVSFSVKATAALTKDEFFRAKVGPNGQSVNDLIEKRCYQCHNSAGSYANTAYTHGGVVGTYYQFSSPHMILSKGAAANLGIIKNVLDGSFNPLDLTAGKLYNFASIHKTSVLPFTTAEKTHIQTYVNHP